MIIYPLKNSTVTRLVERIINNISTLSSRFHEHHIFVTFAIEVEEALCTRRLSVTVSAGYIKKLLTDLNQILRSDRSARSDTARRLTSHGWQRCN